MIKSQHGDMKFVIFLGSEEIQVILTWTSFNYLYTDFFLDGVWFRRRKLKLDESCQNDIQTEHHLRVRNQMIVVSQSHKEQASIQGL